MAAVATKLVRVKASGQLVLVNVEDVREDLHEDPSVPVPQSKPAPSGPPAAETAKEREARIKAKLADSNVAEVAEMLSSVQSEAILDELEGYEKAGKDRAGVRKAIAERRAALKE